MCTESNFNLYYCISCKFLCYFAAKKRNYKLYYFSKKTRVVNPLMSLESA